MFTGSFLEDVQSYVVRSAQTGKEYTLSTVAPLQDEPSEPRPLLIVLDAPYILGTVVETVRIQEMAGEITAPLLLGVGTAGGIAAHASQRIRDYTPPDFDPQAALEGPVGTLLAAKAEADGLKVAQLLGGADLFLDFLTNDVLPEFTERHEFDAGKVCLFGHSAGAVFCHYALLSGKVDIADMIIGSLGSGWYGENLGGLERDFIAGKESLTPKRIFLGVGEAELNHLKFGPALQGGLNAMERLSHALPGQLELTQSIFGQESHCSVMAPIVAAGVRNMFGTGQSFLDVL